MVRKSLEEREFKVNSITCQLGTVVLHLLQLWIDPAQQF